MSDFNSQLPVRAVATQFTTEVADSTGATINPAKEDGHLATIDTTTAEIATDTDKLDVNLSTRLADATFTGRINTQGQKTMAGSTPVVIASDQTPILVTLDGDQVVELPQYNTAAAIAANASSTQTYSPGSTVNLDAIEASASGQMKVEVQWGTTGSETTKFVFFTSKGNLVGMVSLPNNVQITNTMSIKVIRTNLDNQAMDVYSTIFVH